MRHVAHLLSLASWCALAPVAAGQSPTPLGKATAEFAEPFTQITSIRELPGGKVLVADRQDKIVQLVDFSTGSAVKVGREGQGPGEYALPSTLLPQPDGKTLLHDMLARRYLEITPDGKPGDVVTLPSQHSGPGGGMIFMGGGQQADAKGVLYLQAPAFDPGNPGVTKDSVAILRWSRGSTDYDTAAWVAVPQGNVSAQGGRNRMEVRVGGAKVFAPQESWGVAGDGAVARVTPNPYRVAWYAPGKAIATLGPVVPWTPIPVTDADKKAVIEARKRARPLMVTIGNGNARAAAPPNVQLPEPEFAETKPPFSGPGSVLIAPEGEVWVVKNQPAGQRQPEVDVFDRTGKLARRVTLPPKTRLVGFGTGSVYLARIDEEDLEYLGRYPRP